MKRFFYWTINALALLSLVLCVATTILWVRSYWALDLWGLALPQFGDETANDSVSMATGEGGIRLNFERYGRWSGLKRMPQRTEPNQFLWGHRSIPPYYPVELNPNNPENHGFSFKGFEFLSNRLEPSKDSNGYGVTFQCYLLAPLWAWMLLWAGIPIVRWVLIKKRERIERRRSSGQCARCGYDLRASTGRCPECGTVLHVKLDGANA